MNHCLSPAFDSEWAPWVANSITGGIARGYQIAAEILAAITDCDESSTGQVAWRP